MSWIRFKRAKLLAALSLIARAARGAGAQPAPNVNGRVIDAFSLRPIAGAIVEAGDAKTVTDADGRFQLTLPRGTTRISVSAERYLADQVDVTVAEVPVTVEVVLLDRAQFKEDVVVRAGAVSGVRPVWGTLGLCAGRPGRGVARRR
jgi:hypothetical protein